MRLAATSLLVSAASASLLGPQQQHQQVLGGDRYTTRPIAETLEGAGGLLKSWEDALRGMTSEARALWDEVKLLVPGAFEQTSFFSSPQKHTRRPDSEWDHIVKGADVQKLRVQTAEGERPKIGGSLESYNLRTRKVDPAKLGIDTVKQYSGYLDDEANDKHLFYCMFSP